MFFLLGLCNKYSSLQVFYITKVFLKIICYILPVLIIVKSIYNFIDPIVSGNAEEMKEKVILLIKRIIIGFIVVLLPTVVTYIFNNIVDASGNEILTCIENSSREKLDALKEEEEAKKEAEKKVEIERRDRLLKEAFEKEREKLENKKVKNLNYIAQGNYSHLPFCSTSTVASSGCGAASFAMIASSYSDSKYNMEYVASWFCTNQYSLSNGALRNEAVLSQTTLSHFGLEGGIIFGGGNYSGSTYNSTYGNAILNAVQNGKSVMLGIPKHWVVAGPNDSCSSEQVYLYDPGFPSRNGCYTPYNLFLITYNSRNHCIKEGICGWDIGIALS